MKKILIQRFKENPLLKPDDIPWLKWYPKFLKGVNNCGVVFENGIFHMLFRGGSRIFSQIGYAYSQNGINFKVYSQPVLKFYEKNFWQGKTIAGIEDPRIVKWIDGYFYIFATACSIFYQISGGKRGHLGIWKTRNFFDFEFVASPIKNEGKNAAVLGPINNFAYLIYRRFPDIWICQTKDSTLKGSWFNHKKLLSVKDVFIDPFTKQKPIKIGIAGPPIKTPKGWFLIFHIKYGGWSMNSFLYTLSFMVLDLKNPYKVIYLHQEPILRPERPEEIYGCTPNVCFSCATVDFNDKIYVYYGGADTVICGGFLNKEDLKMCY
jgi:predicted GH43/DUF377 family glycosyl hydrolase